MQRSTGLAYQKCLRIVEKNAQEAAKRLPLLSGIYPAASQGAVADLEAAQAAGDITMPAGPWRWRFCDVCDRAFLRTDEGETCVACIAKSV